MNICRRCGYYHEGSPSINERVVVTAKLRTSPSWCYTNPRGVVVQYGPISIVRLDDGTLKDVNVANLRRACGWKPPKLRTRKPRLMPGRNRYLREGPWSEETLPL